MTLSATAVHLGRIGVWSGEIRFAGPEAGVAAAKALEDFGWSSLWMPGGFDDRVLADIDRMLSATRTMTFATGILNIWKYQPAQVADWWRSQAPERQARVLIGLGVSHAPVIGDAYKRPVETMRAYVQDLLDAGVPREHLCVAALGPKMLELSAELTAGAHPYLVPPEHTAIARKTLGPDALLAPEQGVVMESDPARARELARQALATYLALPNYLNSWRRLGFSEEDISGVSDRLVDALFAWGDVEAIRDRLQAHFDAGADHVCLQVITGPIRGDTGPVQAAWQELAAALL